MRRFQTTSVSRWFVMPTAAMESGPAPPPGTAARAPRAHSRTRSQISSGSCSTQADLGKIWRCSFWHVATGRPSWSKSITREEVVPWSIAATKRRGPSAEGADETAWGPAVVLMAAAARRTSGEKTTMGAGRAHGCTGTERPRLEIEPPTKHDARLLCAPKLAARIATRASLELTGC